MDEVLAQAIDEAVFPQDKRAWSSLGTLAQGVRLRYANRFLAALEEAGYVVVEKGRVERLILAVDIALGVEDAEFISGHLRPSDLEPLS